MGWREKLEKRVEMDEREREEKRRARNEKRRRTKGGEGVKQEDVENDGIISRATMMV